VNLLSVIFGHVWAGARLLVV